jgi:hypothetical protein
VSTDIGVGDSEYAYLDVQPADANTDVTLVVEAPDGTTTTVPMTGGALTDIDDSDDQSQRWTGDNAITYDQPGRWVLHYTVAGTGAGTEDLEVWVGETPTGGGPTWAPGRARVANYVPHRTLATAAASVLESSDSYAMTFDATTLPTGVQVDRLIADGIDWVSALVAPMNAGSEAAAALIAALYAAIAVERGWPNDASSLQRANDMEKRLDAMIAALVEANVRLNGEDTDESDAGEYGLDIAYPYDYTAAYYYTA